MERDDASLLQRTDVYLQQLGQVCFLMTKGKKQGVEVYQ